MPAMTPEERQLLIQTHRMTEENNKLLRKMRRADLWARAWKIFYWVVIIGAAIGAYIYIQPYIAFIEDLYRDIFGDTKGLKDAASRLPVVEELLQQNAP